MGKTKRSSSDAEKRHEKWVGQMQKNYLSPEAHGYTCANCKAACSPNNWLYHTMEPERGVLCFYSEIHNSSHSDYFRAGINGYRGPNVEYTMNLSQKLKFLCGVGVKSTYDKGITNYLSQPETVRVEAEDPYEEDVADMGHRHSYHSSRDRLDGHDTRKCYTINELKEHEEKIESNSNVNNNNNKCDEYAPDGATNNTEVPPDVSTAETANPQSGASGTHTTNEVHEHQNGDCSNISDDSDEPDWFGKKSYVFPSDDEPKRYFCIPCIMTKGTEKVKNEVRNICLQWAIHIDQLYIS